MNREHAVGCPALRGGGVCECWLTGQARASVERGIEQAERGEFCERSCWAHCPPDPDDA